MNIWDCEVCGDIQREEDKKYFLIICSEGDTINFDRMNTDATVLVCKKCRIRMIGELQEFIGNLKELFI